jgi:hypothetical protein
MKIHSATVHELSDTLYKQIFILNYGSIGYMRKVLAKCYSHHPSFTNGEIVYIKRFTKVVAWTLIFCYDGERHQHLWTDIKHRGKGYGTALAQYGIKKYPDIHGHHPSSTVFANVGHGMSSNNYHRAARN